MSAYSGLMPAPQAIRALSLVRHSACRQSVNQAAACLHSNAVRHFAVQGMPLGAAETSGSLHTMLKLRILALSAGIKGHMNRLDTRSSTATHAEQDPSTQMYMPPSKPPLKAQRLWQHHQGAHGCQNTPTRSISLGSVPFS